MVIVEGQDWPQIGGQSLQTPTNSLEHSQVVYALLGNYVGILKNME